MGKDKPIISVYATAINTYWWQELYDNLSTSEIPFEIVFCGDREPNFVLPDNFKFVYSKVKPTQCSEIAFINTNGKIVMNIGDDAIFSDSFLDNMYKAYIKKNKNSNRLTLISPVQLSKNNKRPIFSYQYGFWHNAKGTLMLPWGNILPREIREKNVMDRRFVTSFAELDLSLRLISKGAKVKFIEKAQVWERISEETRRLTGTSFAKRDRELLNSLWSKSFQLKRSISTPIYRQLKLFKKNQRLLQKDNGKLGKKEVKLLKRKIKLIKNLAIFDGLFDPSEILEFYHRRGVIYNKRQKEILPFLKEDILLFSQGNKGQWK